MSKIAIIPARGGSKRIPRKNIKDFLGKPIIAYSIETAIKSNLFAEIMVSTDDNEIADVAREYGAKVPFMRSAKNSDDYANISEVCIEVLEEYAKIGKKFDYMCCILPTAPFLTTDKIQKAENIIENEDCDCVFTATEYSYPIQRSFRIDNYFVMKWPENFEKRSQDLEKSYHDAGQLYFVRVDLMLEEKRWLLKKSKAVILNNIEVQDIDTNDDWEIAEIKYKITRKNSIK
jgi:pseudaminic acid cytidylyltransferase